MADFDLRNPAQDNAGSGAGLIIAGIIILLFMVGMLFVGGSGSVVTDDGSAPAAAGSEMVPPTDG